MNEPATPGTPDDAGPDLDDAADDPTDPAVHSGPEVEEAAQVHSGPEVKEAAQVHSGLEVEEAAQAFDRVGEALDALDADDLERAEALAATVTDGGDAPDPAGTVTPHDGAGPTDPD